MPGAIALAAVFLVTVIEMVFSPGQHVCAKPVPMVSAGMLAGDVPAQGGCAERGTAALSRRQDGSRGPAEARNNESPKVEYAQDQAPPPDDEKTTSTIPLSVLRRLGPLRGRTTSVGRSLQRMGEEVERLDRIEEKEARQISRRRSDHKNVSTKAEDALENDDDDHSDNGHNHNNNNDNDNDKNHQDRDDGKYGVDLQPLTPEQKRKKSLMQCMLLEMGILFHSVFIGMALSVSVGSDFIVLLIAITFHRKWTTFPEQRCFSSEFQIPISVLLLRQFSKDSKAHQSSKLQKHSKASPSAPASHLSNGAPPPSSPG